MKKLIFQKRITEERGLASLGSMWKKKHRRLGVLWPENCFSWVSSLICNSLIWQSSPMVRAKKGTEGKSRRASLMAHSRYLSFFKSSMFTGRSDEPAQQKPDNTGQPPERTGDRWTYQLSLRYLWLIFLINNLLCTASIILNAQKWASRTTDIL